MFIFYYGGLHMAGILETVGKNFTNNLIKGVNTAIKVKADGLGAISEYFNENKFDRYDDTTKVITNSMYKVTPMDKNTLDTIAQDTDNTELWLLEDSSKKDYETAYGTRNIGKRVAAFVLLSNNCFIADKLC